MNPMALYTWTSSLMTGSDRSSGSIQTVGRRSGGERLANAELNFGSQIEYFRQTIPQKVLSESSAEELCRRFTWVITCVGKLGQYDEQAELPPFFSNCPAGIKVRHRLPIANCRTVDIADCERKIVANHAGFKTANETTGAEFKLRNWA